MTDLERALVHLQSAYRVELDELQTHAYKLGLADLSGEVVREAVARAILRETRFPVVATIRARALEVQAERRRQHEQRRIGCPTDGPIWQMSDADHAKLMRAMAATKRKLFGKTMTAKK